MDNVIWSPSIQWRSLKPEFSVVARDKERTSEQQYALNAFLTAVERRAFRMAEFATHNPDDALDIVQDSMFKLVERYRDRPEAEWGPLFQTILQSRITDWYRRQSLRRRLFGWLKPSDDEDEGDILETIADDDALDPAEQLALSRDSEALLAGIARLPLRQQQAFLLRAWEQLSVEDTARAMGCSEGSVKTHYFRALKALRAMGGLE